MDIRRSEKFNFYYHNYRHYNKDFFYNETCLKNEEVLETQLNLAHDYVQKNIEDISQKNSDLSFSKVLKYGRSYKYCAHESFFCYLSNYKNSLFLYFMPTDTDSNQDIISYKIIDRPINTLSNIACERYSQSRHYIAFSFEVMVIVMIYSSKKNTLTQHINKIFPTVVVVLDINTKSNYLVAICEDYSIYKLALNSDSNKDSKPLKIVDKNTQILQSIFALDDYIAGQSPQGQLYLWDVHGGRKILIKNKVKLKQYKEVSSKICATSTIKDMNYICFMQKTGKVYVEDLEAGEFNEVFKAPKGVLSFKCALSRPFMFCYRDNGQIDLYSAINGT